ncbi:hypothetical protein A7Q09_08020 [Methylacidiphilum sp. Yel]|nr:hypothetical protein A7Q09_08020 [Methylacidiphilum sp. Yel]
MKSLLSYIKLYKNTMNMFLFWLPPLQENEPKAPDEAPEPSAPSPPALPGFPGPTMPPGELP